MKCFVRFVLGSAVFAGAVLAAASFVAGSDVLVPGGTAFLLAFVPAAGTLGWVLYSFGTTPDMQLLASLGGSGLRMAIGLGGGLLLTSLYPETFALSFWSWLVFFYLVLLALEMVLLIRNQPKDAEAKMLINDFQRTGGKG